MNTGLFLFAIALIIIGGGFAVAFEVWTMKQTKPQ